MPQLSRKACEVSGAAKMHPSRCTGRITEVSESVTPLARAAQGIGKKKSPGVPGLVTNFDFDQVARRATRFSNYFASFAI